MLNIHSFLQRMKDRITMSGGECYKSCLLVAAYTMIAIILVLNSDSLSGKSSSSVIEAYAKAEEVPEAFVKTNEETAKEANIRTEQNEENLKITSDEMIAVGTMGGVVEAVIGQVQEEQQELKEQEAMAVKKAKEEKQRAARKKAAEKKAKEEKEKKEKAKNTIVLSAEEKKTLQRIVEAEATGEDVKGRVLVANVILNRVKSKQFPDTVKGVVFQRDGGSVQFSPTKDGRYWSVTISEKTKQAVEKALSGVDYSQGALYFSARSRADKSNMRWFDTHLKWLFKYRGHEFYTNR